MSRAALIAVGSELLGPHRRETNTSWIAEQLEQLGVEVGLRTIVADDEAVLATTISNSLKLASCVIVTGGIGPTEDDRTRAALARALGLPLERDPAEVQALQQRFARVGLRWSAAQERQADRPAGARWVHNPVGTADGLWVTTSNGRSLIALPGVPAEMRAMVSAGLGDWVGADGRDALARVRITTAGRSESAVDALLAGLSSDEDAEITVLTGLGTVEIELQSRAGAGCRGLLRVEQLRDEVAARLGEDLVSIDGDSLPVTIGRLLREAGQTLATAESCTAGCVAASVTAVAGSSAWFRGGWVVYHDDLKRDLAGIDATLLKQHGAVSEAVARRLAEAVRERCGASWGLGVTGVAGPGGGSADKPVGLVHLALASAHGAQHWETRQIGDRHAIRERSVTFALDRLRRALLSARC